MKILCEYEHCAFSYIFGGWKKVFESIGHDFKFWMPSTKPAFDAFSEYEPDIFIGRTYTLNRALAKNIAMRPNMKVAMHASVWGDLIDKIDAKKYPIIRISEKEKENFIRLKQQTGRPDCVFIHHHENWLEPTMGGWRSIGIKPVAMANAADLFDYTTGRFRPEFESDLCFIGGYWPYKAVNLDRFIIPLCRSKYKIKIFGNQPWPVPQYLGYVETEDVKDIFASSKICLNVSEPHATSYGFDIVERPMKVLAGGNFCISDYVQSAVEDIFGDSLPSAKTPQEFFQLIEHYINNPEERKEKSLEGQRIVLENHTYFDRVRDLLNHLELPSEAKKVEDKKTEILRNLY